MTKAHASQAQSASARRRPAWSPESVIGAFGISAARHATTTSALQIDTSNTLGTAIRSQTSEAVRNSHVLEQTTSETLCLLDNASTISD